MKPIYQIWNECFELGQYVRKEGLDGLAHWQDPKKIYEKDSRQVYPSEKILSLLEKLDIIGTGDFADAKIYIDGIIMDNQIEEDHFFV